MMRVRLKIFLSIFVFSYSSANPIWDEATPYPLEGVPNPYQLPDEEYFKNIRSGLIHSQNYPVEITGILLPYYPIKKFANLTPLRFDDLQSWLGLHVYPENENKDEYYIPFPDSKRPEDRIGLSLIKINSTTGFTFSCAACHSGQLFGRTVLGLTNRFPRANELFVLGRKAFQVLPSPLFKQLVAGSKADRELYKRSRTNIRSVAAVRPQQLGLDTSLAHVALSLARRAPDIYASKNKYFEQHPRPEPLNHFVSDSKPAVWWNVKYKNRWLLDGSVVSGNPILTNILWNEIGRGTDLLELEGWFEKNQKTIQELTTAVFSSRSPLITDFFSADRFDIGLAKRGEAIFNRRCAHCHGQYVKNWSLDGADRLPLKEQLKTLRVLYHEQTPVIDVGTDPQRALGMKSLLQLNDLSLSKKYGIAIRAQRGYVPPPLVGIWARWPYFHNNSAPSLCAVLTPEFDRPETYWAGDANDPETDFDFDCNGYPSGGRVPQKWRRYRELLFDTQKPGLSNKGHSEGILVRDSKLLVTSQDRTALIHFLQTL